MSFTRCAHLFVLTLAAWASSAAPSAASIIEPLGGIHFGFAIVSIQSIPDSGSLTFRPRDVGLSDADSTTVATWRISPSEISIGVDFELGPDLSEPGFMATQTRSLTFMVDTEVDYRLSGSLALENVVAQSLQWTAGLGARPSSSPVPFTSLFIDGQQEANVTSWNTTLGESGPGDGFRVLDGAISGRLVPGTVYTLPFVVAVGGIQSTGGTPRILARYAITVVPEPSVSIFLGLGLVALASSRSPRRFRRSTSQTGLTE